MRIHENNDSFSSRLDAPMTPIRELSIDFLMAAFVLLSSLFLLTIVAPPTIFLDYNRLDISILILVEQLTRSRSSHLLVHLAVPVQYWYHLSLFVKPYSQFGSEPFFDLRHGRLPFPLQHRPRFSSLP